VMAVLPGAGAAPESPEHAHLVEIFANQTALALERTLSAAAAEDAPSGVETEQMRSSLPERGFARSAHAAGLDHRRGHQPAWTRGRGWTGGNEARAAREHRRGSRTVGRLVNNCSR